MPAKCRESELLRGGGEEKKETGKLQRQQKISRAGNSEYYGKMTISKRSIEAAAKKNRQPNSTEIRRNINTLQSLNTLLMQVSTIIMVHFMIDQIIYNII